MGRKKKARKISTVQLNNLRLLLQAGVQFLEIKKISLAPGRYFWTDNENNIIQSCLLGGLILKKCNQEKINWSDFHQKNILCFETARTILNCSKQKLRMIILGFDDSFEYKKPMSQNKCYQLGFSFGGNK